jgi:hypothetical protein
MASFGSLKLDILDSGIAQLLVKPPRAHHEFNHQGATFPKEPYNSQGN